MTFALYCSARRRFSKVARIGIEKDHSITWRNACFAASVILFVSACSPVFNWREVAIADTGAAVLLPCKPDRAQQAVPLFDGSKPLQLHMVGCATAGATFSASVVALPATTSEASAQSALDRWQQATQLSLKAAEFERSKVDIKGAQAAYAIKTNLVQAGTPQSHQAVYAIGRGSQGVMLVQLQVLGQPREGADGPSAFSAEALTTFLTGIRW